MVEALVEVIADLHAERYGIHTISFRLSNPYGPHDSTDPRKGARPAGLRDARAGTGGALRDQGQPAGRARLHLRRRRRRRVRPLPGDAGDERRAQPLPRRDHDPARPRPHHPGGGGEDRPVHAPDTATHGVLARRSTNRRLRERFGMSTFTGLADGLRPTIAWYREAYREGAPCRGLSATSSSGRTASSGATSSRGSGPRAARSSGSVARRATSPTGRTSSGRCARRRRPAGSSTW